MNLLESLYHSINNAEADLADLYVGEHAKKLLVVGLDPISVADALMTNALAIAVTQVGDDLEARKFLVRWHRLTREAA